MRDLLSKIKKFRSHSQSKILHPANARRSTSSQSTDLFSLVVPSDHDSSLSSLRCPICSLAMTKPTLLPCQHTFCFKCLQNTEQVRPGSLPTLARDSLTSKDHRIKTITCPTCLRIHRINSLADLEQNQSVQLLVNTLLCETCYELYPSNQMDTCLHCFGALCPRCYDHHIASHQKDLKTNPTVDQTPSPNDTQAKKEPTPNNSPKHEKKTGSKPTIEITAAPDETVDPAEPTTTKRKSSAFFHRLIHPIQHRHSANEADAKLSPRSVKRSLSARLPRRSKTIIPIKMDEVPTVESHSPAVPITPVTRFKNFNELYTDTAERIKHCKQRQTELDRSVQKLIEVLTTKINETMNQVTQYWSYLKGFSFDQLQSKSNRFQLFDYLLKTCCSTAEYQKQMASYFEQNDEIKAALQVLVTVLTIVSEQQSHASISQFFDREQQTTLGRLQRHLESLLSSYADELSLIHECINVYESRFAKWRNSSTTDLDSFTHEWSKIIEQSYPMLIERISNDFVSKTPQIEKILFEMLSNLRRRLLTADHPETSQRNTVVSL